MSTDNAFVQWFQQAAGDAPFPFQACFACGETLPQLVHVPTGLGKTAMAVLGWLGWCEERSPHSHLKTGWCP
jgi:CRISPR-associated endonuclease/helicase Cas3